jgi:hypothetical protein
MKAVLFATAASLIFGGAASAANLVQNGGFESNGGNGQVGDGTTLANWSTSAPPASYVFVYNADGGASSGSSADVLGDPAPGEYGAVHVWGPDDGSANGLTESPGGGAFITSNPAFQNSAITQTISGLTAGASYELKFDWAGGEQQGFDGTTSEGWQVSLGSQTFNTGNMGIGDKGFTGWQNGDFTFTATGPSETLSFLATGVGVAAEPPLALLDDVSLTPVPEPAAWALMFTGVGVLGAALRLRRRQIAMMEAAAA